MGVRFVMGLRFGMVSDRVVAVKCGGVSPAPLPILVVVIDVEVFFFLVYGLILVVMFV